MKTTTDIDFPEHMAMKVRVVDRGTSRSYEGVKIRTVAIQRSCPKCGGPRGEVYSHRFCEDGAWYDCDRWDNPCGHVDMYTDVLIEARELVENSKPRFPTCDDDVSMNLHMLGRAFGFEWCECDHTAIIKYRNNRGGAELEEGKAPAWWAVVLIEALEGTESAVDGEFVRELQNLHDAIASGQSTWDRWDEFDSYWTEARLRLLEALGLARVVVGVWEHQDGKNVWHGEECGCLEIDLELLAVPTVAKAEA